MVTLLSAAALPWHLDMFGVYEVAAGNTRRLDQK